MSSILVLILLAIAAWVLWKSKTDNGFDLKQGWWALLAGAVAVWEWINGSISNLLG